MGNGEWGRRSEVPFPFPITHYPLPSFPSVPAPPA